MEIDAPVHFTPRNELNRINYAFCKILGKAEHDAVTAGNHKPNGNYDTSDVGLHFPDMGICEYYDFESNRNPAALKSLIGDISNQMRVYINEIPLLYAVHCVLHEYGHWLHFLSTGMSSYEFWEEDQKIRQPFQKIAKGIYKMSDSDPFKIIAGKEYHERIYSQFPTEKAANQYASDHFLDAITKIRNYFGYSENDLLNQIVADK